GRGACTATGAWIDATKIGLGRDKERSPRVPQDPGASATRLKRAALAYWTRKVPGSAMAPGPGRSATASMLPLPVDGMQNTEASVAVAAVPVLTGPAAMPFSVMRTQAALPKQPGLIWLGQNEPVASAGRLLVEGSRGERDGNHADVRAVEAEAASWGARTGLIVGRAAGGGGGAPARRAVTRVARRAGGHAGHPGTRAAVAGPRHALRARLVHVAGEVDVGVQRHAS